MIKLIGKKIFTILCSKIVVYLNLCGYAIKLHLLLVCLLGSEGPKLFGVLVPLIAFELLKHV